MLARGIAVSFSVAFIPSVVTCPTFDWVTQGGVQANLILLHPLPLPALHALQMFIGVIKDLHFPSP